MPFQSKFALKRIQKGRLIIAARSETVACLITSVNTSSSLREHQKNTPIVKIDDHIGMAFTGLEADSRVLMNYSREQAQDHRLSYNEPIPLGVLVEKVASICQNYSQSDRKRPFGSAQIYIGMDSLVPRVYINSPSGNCKSYNAYAIGFNSDVANNLLSSYYEENMLKTDLFNFLFYVLDMSIQEKVTKENLRMGFIGSEEGRFKMVEREKLDTLVRNITPPSSQQNEELFLINQALENIKEILQRKDLPELVIERKYLWEFFDDALINIEDPERAPTLIPLVHSRFRKNNLEILYNGDLMNIRCS
ncbi:MAG: hypothetical protein ACFFAS_02340 [Promethearchaeota archaeon]